MMSHVLHLVELVNVVWLLDKIGQKSFKENYMSNEAVFFLMSKLFLRELSQGARGLYLLVNKFTTKGKLRQQQVLW